MLFAGSSLFSFVIKVKTFSPVSHVEVALNPNYALACRDGLGTDLYPLRLRGLYAVRRPTTPMDWGAAMAWFGTVKGQPYSYWQAMRFFRLGKENVTKTMCSPFATRLYRKGGFHPFAGKYDASLVSPGMFLSAVPFEDVWFRQ
jgi:hypothetical protein